MLTSEDNFLNNGANNDHNNDKKSLSTATSRTSLAPTIDDFEIIKPISRGAFGKVFLGRKRNDDTSKVYAIKVLKKSEAVQKNMVSQVIAERNALALNRSPFCVNLFYCLQSANNVFLVMEYLIGGDLKSLLGHCGFFDEATSRFYVAEIALALQYLHKRDIVHRDLKPDNVLLTAKGHVKLTDFGLSKVGVTADLHVADLVSHTPFVKRTAAKRAPRTPGQILSLTSHLSFVKDENERTFEQSSTDSFQQTMSAETNSTVNTQVSKNSHYLSNSLGHSPELPPRNLTRNGGRISPPIERPNGQTATKRKRRHTTDMEDLTEEEDKIIMNAKSDLTTEFAQMHIDNMSKRKTVQRRRSSKRHCSRVGEALSDSEIEKNEQKTKTKRPKKERRRYNSSESMLKTSLSEGRTNSTEEGGAVAKTPPENEATGPCYQYSTPLSSLPIRRRNVHFINVPDDTPINLVDLDKSFDKETCSTPIEADASPKLKCDTINQRRLFTSPVAQNKSSIVKAGTPKNIRGRMASSYQSDNRILGTPDYLAPELLLRQPHTAAVDWWGLGVCLYEFMTGVPPFSDETPEAVFDNILTLRLEWPSADDGDEVLSDAAIQAITSLLTLDPIQRIGFEGMKELKLFEGLDWNKVLETEETPFIPQPDDETDTAYFEMRNNLQHWKVSQFQDQ